MKKLLLIALMLSAQTSLAGEFKGKLICFTAAMTQVGILDGLTATKLTGNATQQNESGFLGTKIMIDLEKVSRAEKGAPTGISVEYKVEGVKGLVILNVGFYYKGEIKQGNLAGLTLSLGHGKRDKDGIMNFQSYASTRAPLVDDQSYNLEIFPRKGQLLKTEVECFISNE